MPIEQTAYDVMKMSKEVRIRVLENVNAELVQLGQIREEQVKLSQEERSKINFLSFAIAGAVLGFSPVSLQNPWVVFGLSVILLNAFLFGFVADALQRNLNIDNADNGLKEVKKTVRPYFDAYDEVGKFLDDKFFTQERFQKKYNKLQSAYFTYLEEHKKNSEEPRLAKRTILAIGYWYFAWFATGLIIMGFGLVVA